MTNRINVTLKISGPDVAAIARHLVAVDSLGSPARLLGPKDTTAAPTDWLERCLNLQDKPLAVAWSPGIADGPVLQFHPSGLLELIWPVPQTSAELFLRLLRGCPFEVAVVQPLYAEWTLARMGSPLFLRRAFLTPGFGPLGWACLFRGAGLDRLCGRRFLEHGPWRSTWLDPQTAVVEFHDIEDDPETAMKRAAPGHLVMTSPKLGSVCFDPASHSYEHDLRGIYAPADQTYRIVVVDRELSPREMLDACVYRARMRHDAEQPVRNVAFVFPKHEQAQSSLTQLWLRELECRIIDDEGVERTLGVESPPQITRPDWVGTPPSVPLV